MYFEILIKPAVLQLLAEEDGAYRVEHELHHHLTLCLNQVTPLRLGRWDRVVRYEEPTTGKYNWSGYSSRSGNVDFFFPGQGSSLRSFGTAMELNCKYYSWGKIRKDFIKLIDPVNAYQETVYFAYGFKRNFKETVADGLERAFQSFREKNSDFLLPVGLHVLVVESQRGRGKRNLWETKVTEPSLPGQLTWEEIPLPYTVESREAREETGMSGQMTGLYMSRGEAESVLRAEMEKAGIPLNSITVRCMFEPTKDSRGGNNCKLGRSPLWENHLRVVSGKVLRSEFMDWVDRLIESGRKFQKAGRASWGSS